MRGWPITAALAVAVSVAGAQEEAPAVLYAYPDPAIEGGFEIVEPVTQASGPLLDAPDGEPPDPCPSGAYYRLPTEVVVSCDTGARYRAMPAVDVPAYFQLRQLPDNGTDEPGPSVE